MKDKKSWFVHILDDEQPRRVGRGECGPLPGLSVDDRPDFESVLAEVCDAFDRAPLTTYDPQAVRELVPQGFPSITFGLETALLDFFNGGKYLIFDNPFFHGQPIPINGLIWMGDMDFMMRQVSEKIEMGFKCLKLKVGGLDFDRECALLDHIRKKYSRADILLRLDANGAFKPGEAMHKLEVLSRYHIHSIEQPVPPGTPVMHELCRMSPIPIALDEELIGVETTGKMEAILENLKPSFIVLKPTLHGGFMGCEQWIETARQLRTGWWITSALESSIGLNAICQFAGNYPTDMYQGLGTGNIYENNIGSPLKVRNGTIRYDAAARWEGEEVEEEITDP